MDRQTKRPWVVTAVIVAVVLVVGYPAMSFLVRLTRAEAAPERGFHWRYYLYVPGEVKRRGEAGEELAILVLPNNTGRVHDALRVHDRAAVATAYFNRDLAEKLEVALLVPVFPRPQKSWKIYTHALDRDCLTVDVPTLARLDLQLGGMIEDARRRLARRGWDVRERVLLYGFSASGMFANRFALLHPERVLAAAVGSPGGWPIAPVAAWEGRALRYPIGIHDVEELTGKPFDLGSYRAVPHLFLLGDHDENDSVSYTDGYEEEDAELVNALFGPTPVERWAAAGRVYESVGADAVFRLYPSVGHEATPQMDEDVKVFLASALGRKAAGEMARAVGEEAR